MRHQVSVISLCEPRKESSAQELIERVQTNHAKQQRNASLTQVDVRCSRNARNTCPLNCDPIHKCVSTNNKVHLFRIVECFELNDRRLFTNYSACHSKATVPLSSCSRSWQIKQTLEHLNSTTWFTPNIRRNCQQDSSSWHKNITVYEQCLSIWLRCWDFISNSHSTEILRSCTSQLNKSLRSLESSRNMRGQLVDFGT